ncbi:MAG TPA: LysM peptidoglycan-binding domain-containing protein, partial [Polyangiaceae bacterium]|nr:LysM peptidoglycan-binding domain-containing protein [Polyangiaceae bacterium]
MQRSSHFAAWCALTFCSSWARAQGFGPDTATPAIPADSGGAVVIAPQNDGSTQVWSATNPGESVKAGPSRSVVVTNAPPPGTGNGAGASTDFRGSNAILSDDEQAPLGPVPDIHLVQRGDTLWDLGDRYYRNPWVWPKIWSYNPQIVNPHWIYPGDQLRLTNATGNTESGGMKMLSLLPRQSTTLGGGGGSSSLRPRSQIVGGTIFLRDQGYLGDPKRDVWGELIGSDEEQMMLAEGNHVVLNLRPGVKVVKGQELTVFTSVRQPENVAGARKPAGEIVAVRGTVKVIDFNPETRMARAMLTESVDVVERGAMVGPVGRRFDVVPPLKTSAKVSARVLTSIYPNVYIARDQIAFLDKG